MSFWKFSSRHGDAAVACHDSLSAPGGVGGREGRRGGGWEGACVREPVPELMSTCAYKEQCACVCACDHAIACVCTFNRVSLSPLFLSLSRALSFSLCVCVYIETRVPRKSSGAAQGCVSRSRSEHTSEIDV